MFRRARSTFALAATLLALVMQWCVPLAHAAHAAHERAVASAHVDADHGSHDHHHHHDTDAEHRHDASRCPTCQHIVALRAFTPTVAPVTLAVAPAPTTEAPPPHVATCISHTAHTPAAPRAPPAS